MAHSPILQLTREWRERDIKPVRGELMTMRQGGERLILFVFPENRRDVRRIRVIIGKAEQTQSDDCMNIDECWWCLRVFDACMCLASRALFNAWWLICESRKSFQSKQIWTLNGDSGCNLLSSIVFFYLLIRFNGYVKVCVS